MANERDDKEHSDTPRTDAVFWIDSNDVEVCTAYFARQLERDLTVSKGLEHMAYDQRDKAFDKLNAMQSAVAPMTASDFRLMSEHERYGVYCAAYRCAAAFEIKFNDECNKHDATTARAMKAERALRSAIGERWIPVSERLPEKAGRYIVSIKPLLEDERIVIFSRYVPPDHAAISGWYESRVTHWMPIPSAPTDRTTPTP